VTAVERYFFTPLYQPRSTWSVVEWWEARRLIYNIVVGGAGAVSLGFVALLEYLPPHAGTFPIPWVLVLMYGALANAGYTLGPVTDLVLRRRLGERAPAVGPALFRYGFVFSVGLSLLPIPLAVLGWFARALL